MKKDIKTCQRTPAAQPSSPLSIHIRSFFQRDMVVPKYCEIYFSSEGDRASQKHCSLSSESKI